MKRPAQARASAAKFSNGKSEGGNHRWDLKALEDRALLVYENWKADDDQKTRTDLFTGVRDLAFAILHVGPYEKYNINFDVVAYEYALYLFERLVMGSFRPQAKDRFPFQAYIAKNILHVIATVKKDGKPVWEDLVADLGFLIDVEEPDYSPSFERTLSTGDEETRVADRLHYGRQIWKALRIYYSETEIERLMPIALDLVHDNPRHVVSPSLPEDIRDFSVILVATAKRLAREDNIFAATDVKKSLLSQALASASRSTVFLSTVANTNLFPKELLLALDTDSLYRLVSIMGGKKVRIPTMRQMDTLVGSVVAMGKMLLEGKTADVAVEDAKDDLNLVFSHRFNVQKFISSAMRTWDIFGEDQASEPMISLMIKSIKSLDSLLSEIGARAKTASSEELITEYCKLSQTFSNFTESLIRISAEVRGPVA